MSKALIDTNLLVRYLTGEPEEQAEASHAILTKAASGKMDLRLTALVTAETIFVLTGKVYHYSSKEVQEALLPILESPILDVQDREVLITALEIFTQTGVDFVDACLAAEARLTSQPIASFDKDYDKIPGVLRLDPLKG